MALCFPASQGATAVRRELSLECLDSAINFGAASSVVVANFRISVVPLVSNNWQKPPSSHSARKNESSSSRFGGCSWFSRPLSRCTHLNSASEKDIEQLEVEASVGDGCDNNDNGADRGDNGGGGDDEGGEHKEGGSDKNKVEALLALASLGRALENIPADLAYAIQDGRVTAAIVERFVELEKAPFIGWLMQFGGFKERLLADDLFLTKVAIECGVGIFTKTAAELERRREKFTKELDFVFADVVHS